VPPLIAGLSGCQPIPDSTQKIRSNSNTELENCDKIKVAGFSGSIINATAEDNSESALHISNK
jgi:hypothetical protein